MKKLLALLTIVVSLLSVAMPVFAAVDAEDDLDGLTDAIVNTANDLFENELSRNVAAEDVDYNNSYKIYVGANLFETNIHAMDEIPDVFGADGYIYELPIYIDEDTLLINIAKGQPLNAAAEFTDEERQGILENVGKWQATAMKFYAGETINYAKELQNKVGYMPKESVLVGGLPNFRFAVALLPDKDGNIKSLVPMSDVPGIERISTFCTNKNIYDYQAVKEYINQLPASDDNQGVYGFLEDASSGKKYRDMIIIWGVAILLVVGSIIITHLRKKI